MRNPPASGDVGPSPERPSHETSGDGAKQQGNSITLGAGTISLLSAAIAALAAIGGAIGGAVLDNSHSERQAQQHFIEENRKLAYFNYQKTINAVENYYAELANSQKQAFPKKFEERVVFFEEEGQANSEIELLGSDPMVTDSHNLEGVWAELARDAQRASHTGNTQPLRMVLRSYEHSRPVVNVRLQMRRDLGVPAG